MNDSPPPRSALVRRLVVLLAIVVVVAVAAFVVALQTKSPAQTAADARPPAATLLTAPVAFQELTNSVVFRADVSDADPTGAMVPASVGTDSPVVTAMDVTVGATVSDGELAASVATRPVFLATGTVPAFRTMAPGDAGIDVRQLQQMLAKLGLFGGTVDGTYGPGTATAVEALYARSGAGVMMTSPTAATDLQTARTTLAQDQAAPASPAKTRTVAADGAALTTLEMTTGAVVPMGEVAFVPILPTRVLSTAGSAGSVVATGSAVLTVGSGQVIARGGVDSSELAGLKVGQPATIHTDGQVAGPASYQATISAIAGRSATDSSGVPTTAVTVRVSGAAAPLVGLNLAVKITLASSNGPVDIVPLSAIASTADGTTSVTVVAAGGGQRVVPVRVLLMTDGGAGVAPISGTLATGARVLLGVAPVTSP